MTFWLAVAAALLGLFWIGSLSRRNKQRETVAALRANFPPIARMRLVSACPGLEGVIQETDLRLLFDWILLQLYGRTGTPGIGELMQWTLEHGEGETLLLMAEVTRDAVDRLPAPVLAVIDGCEGRTLAAVLIDQSLTEAGERIGRSPPAASTDYFGRPE